jgi:hypothetical protein
VETHLTVALIAHAIRAALFLGRRWSMMDPQKYDNMTVAEALTARAGELKELVDWARTRLDRAASLVALAMEPDRPGGEPDTPHVRAEVLELAAYFCDGLRSGLEEAGSPMTNLASLLKRAFDNEMDALGEEEVNDWDADRVARMTVGELAQALDAGKAVTP